MNIFNLIVDINEKGHYQLAQFPEIEKNPDLSGFNMQASDLPSVEHEWVEQKGDDDHGFHGRMAYRLDDGYFLIFEWCD